MEGSNELSNAIIKGWTDAIIVERAELSKVAAKSIDSGNVSRAKDLCHPQIKYIDEVLMKIYLLAKSEAEIPVDIIAQMHKEIFNQKEK